ncbi:MAG: protein kinase, partial [Deltaproteobacteria bacterium]|nr:protein kinase [Deltaproteobacteria bacterium]
MTTAPVPRTSLGRYALVRHLASGGMAEVIIARASGIEGFEHHVVIKRIRDEQARDARFVQMFLDEARLAASLHHHNIVQVHDIGQDNGEYFFAMEYVHGEDLRRLLAHASERDDKIPLDHILTIVTCSAAALHFAHEHRGADRKPLGIVHRDVSPANILVSYDGNVKVVDFGIAKATQQRASTETTLSGVMKGKVAYMSPEQCINQPVDRRSDIFCLGIVLYELVTVRRLFKGANDFLTMSAITSGVIPRPTEFRPDLAPELEAIIMKALAFRPEDRYQTADEMRAALERYAIGAGLRGSTTALGDYMRARFGDRPLPWQDDGDEEDMSIDFDGSGSGMVPTPDAPVFEALGAAPSPIAKAFVRASAKESSPRLPLPADPLVDTVEVGVEAAPRSPSGRVRTSSITGAPDPSGTLSLDALSSIPVDHMPFAGAPAPSVFSARPATQERPQRRRLIGAAIATGAALALVVIIVLAATSSSSTTASAADPIGREPAPPLT